MELQYYKVQSYQKNDRGVETCPHNDACQCDRYQRRDCYRCGWNPKVAQRRSEMVMKGCKV